MVINKQKLLTFCCFIVLISLIFTACSKKAASDSQKEETTLSIASSTKAEDDSGINDNQVVYYDKDGNQSKIEYYSSKNKLVYYTVDIYNNDGNNIGERFYNNKDELKATYYDGTYSKKYGYYNPKGKQLTEDSFLEIMTDLGAVTTTSYSSASSTK